LLVIAAAFAGSASAQVPPSPNTPALISAAQGNPQLQSTAAYVGALCPNLTPGTDLRLRCAAALGAPFPFGIAPAPGKVRIHQALKAAGWDLDKLVAPTDLGVPAFNKGSKWRGTEDFGNGLGVMVNGVQHAYVIATDYAYDKAANLYGLKLKFIFYDVFGLDDDDLEEYGATSDGWTDSAAAVGITAWWQLQHQFGYPPLVTRITVEREYTVLAL